MNLGPYQIDEGRADLIAIVKSYFLECVRKYFPNTTVQVLDGVVMRTVRKDPPTFRIRKQPHSWGQYQSNFAGTVNDMLIHPDLVNYPEVIRKVVYHETIHWADPTDRRSAEMRITKGHGTFFKDAMKTINAHEGADYITVRGEGPDYQAIKLAAKPFFVYWANRANGHIIFMWSTKPYPELGRLLADYNDKEKVAYMVQCNFRNMQIGQGITPNTARKNIYIIKDINSEVNKEVVEFLRTSEKPGNRITA